MFLTIIMKMSGREVDPNTLVSLLGFSIIMGYFLFEIVLMLVVVVVIAILYGVWKKKGILSKFFPPESKKKEVEEF
jgi:hypothetical protein